MPENAFEVHDHRAMVLVADDDPIFRDLVAARLDKLGGRTVEARNGTEAWDLLLEQTFDLAIVDLSMPGLDGFGLIGCMRGYPRTRHLPIVVITSQDDVAVIEQALVAGATSFMTKPVRWATLELHLGFLLRLAESERRSRTALQLANVKGRVQAAVLRRLCRDVMEANVPVRESLASASLGQASHDQIDEALHSIDGIAAVASKSMHLAELLSDGIKASDDPADLAGLLASACRDIEPAAAVAGITLECGDFDHRHWVRCHASSLELALAELLHNAVAHSPAGSKVSISVQLYPDGLLAIDITDTGPGMHPEFLARALSPVADGDDHFDRYESVGCGLMLAKTVAEAHGGLLEVRSLPGQGTTALFLIPPERVICNARVAA